MSTMAEVLAAHHDWEYRKNLGYYRSEYSCQCGATFWGGDHDEDPSMMEARAEHVADELTKAGYGKLADAWDEGHESGFWNGRESAGNVEGLLIGVEHARERNPYRSAS